MKSLCLIIAVFYSVCIFGQESVLENKIYRQLNDFPQEKVYVQTDKSTYVSGEKIWFRAFLVDAIIHQPSLKGSRYVYVELINPAGEKIEISKIRPSENDSTFHNNIVLAEDLPEGTYLLRAYTNFMRNVPDYLFEKKIYVAYPLSTKINVASKFSFNKDKSDLNLKFYDNYGNDLVIQNLSVRIDTGEMTKTRIDKEVSFKATEKIQTVYVEFESGSNAYRKYIPVPATNEDFDVVFLPEGGYIVSDTTCRVAFKAIKANGLSENISVEIFDDSGEKIVSGKSERGMESFVIQAQTGKKYYAVCKNENGVTKRFELPASRDDVCMLRTDWNAENLYISLIKGKKFGNKPLTVLIHLRGLVLYTGIWPAESNTISLERSFLPSGITQILLLDGDNALSERMVFNINPTEPAKIEIATNKDNYKKRELVKTKVNITDANDLALNGNFAVTVTDNKDILPDSSFTIFSNLLLTSDLKGYIEDPGFYINNPYYADVLMMTQGWRRYNIPEVLKGNVEKPTHYLEAGQAISGKAKKLLGKNPEVGVTISMFSPMGYTDKTISGANGEFIFNGFEFPDSTKYIVQALNSRGRSGVELTMDSEDFHPASKFAAMEFNPQILLANYIEKSDRKFLEEYGMRETVLNTSTIVARPPDMTNPSQYANSLFASNPVTSETIQKFNNIYTLLMTFSGVFVSGESVTIRGGNGPPLIVVDDMIMPEEFSLSDINIYDIDNIQVIKGSGGPMIGSRGGSGSIIIMTKTGEITKRKEQFNIKAVVPKGYKGDVEFYSPKYEAGDTKGNDLRTTIHWDPCVNFTNGVAEFDFYTADTEGEYTIVVEGISKEGVLVRGIKAVSRMAEM